MNPYYRTTNAAQIPLLDLGEANPARPSQRPTDEQYALARRYVARECPELLGMLFGGAR